MKLPRPRIWSLMLAVAIVAVGSASWVWVGKSREYSMMAAKYESQELRFRKYAESWQLRIKAWARRLDTNKYSEADRTTIQMEIARCDNEFRIERRFADDSHASAATYRRAARYPWLAAPSDPTRPK
jgi:hypothetical protein